MALVAFDWPARFGDVSGQLARLDERLGRDTAPGDLVLLPELCLTGYVSAQGDFDVSPFAEHRDGPTARRLAELAKAHGVDLVAPLVERADGLLYNTIIGLGADGTRRFVYRKRHPWYPETWATPGDEPLPLASFGSLTVTACICFDIHFVTAEQAGALHAADVLLFPSAWVEEVDQREGHLRTLARTFDLIVVNANWAAGDVVLAGQGRSMIVDGQRVLASAGEAGFARLGFSGGRRVSSVG